MEWVDWEWEVGLLGGTKRVMLIFFFGKMRFGMTCLGLSLEDDTRWSYYKVQCAVLENWTVLNYPTFIITLTAIYPTPSA